MRGLNPNLVLVTIATVTLFLVGGLVAIVFAGGPESAQLALAGIITALGGTVLPGLFGALKGNEAVGTANTAQDHSNGTRDMLANLELEMHALADEVHTGLKIQPPTQGTGGT